MSIERIGGVTPKQKSFENTGSVALREAPVSKSPSLFNTEVTGTTASTSFCGGGSCGGGGLNVMA
jgi:hypothetical protein